MKNVTIVQGARFIQTYTSSRSFGIAMAITLNLCTLLSTAFIGAANATDDRKQLYAFYRAMKADVQKEFEESLKFFSENRLPTATDKGFADAVDGLKMFHYNKAYIFVQCFHLAPKGPNMFDFINDCAHERLQAMKRILDRSPAPFAQPSSAPLANKCSEQATMTEAEEQFPPYEFLNGSGVHLFDAKKLDDCLSRILR